MRSSKRFAGPTGLEELIGQGLGMALVVAAEPDALVFRSAFYFVDLDLSRLRLPGWLTPGQPTRGAPVSSATVASCSSWSSSTRASAR